MSSKYNDINKPLHSANVTKGILENCKFSNTADTKNYIVETRIKEFQKIPVVLVPRIDIKPYLKTMEKVPTSTLRPGASVGDLTNKYNLNGVKLLNCSVIVFRDDLEKLKISLPDKMEAFITCRICKKNYPDERKLRNHQETKHMIVTKPQKRVSFSDHVIIHEVKEYHKCRKCTKIFENYRLLKLHMKKDHKKRTCYICHYCSKSFVDRTIFKVHIKLHCDMCSILLSSKSKYLEHRRNVCKVTKMYKCRTCKETFFNFMDLKDHSYDHLSLLYICDICKDQFESKCAVSHHIAFLHSNERPVSLFEMRSLGSDRLYLCNFCDESSVDKKIIEAHVEVLPDLSNKAMTGYKDYYFCDQCLKKFDKEQEMLQHKWSHFLISGSTNKSNKYLSKKENQSASSKNDKEMDEKKDLHQIKFIYKLNEPLPKLMQPKIVLERIDYKQKSPLPHSTPELVLQPADENFLRGPNDIENANILLLPSQKAIVDPKSRKTLVSKHQCQYCSKFFSNGYCLRRHIQTMHFNFDDLQCKVCEETFVWPSLLKSHRCIRTNIPEMPFDDARPEIHFNNFSTVQQTDDIDDLNINDDYMNCVDFEIPAPIVELTEYDNVAAYTTGMVNMINHSTAVENSAASDKVDLTMPYKNLSYKVVMQEVPIEF